MAIKMISSIIIDESDGTQRLFDLIPILNENNSNHVVLIDEIDRSLHTNLVRKFIQMFFELTEGNNSQLITTTHDVNNHGLKYIATG